ncbi:hypothetical protein BCON_0058g00010 [Botryotinia convoluta]|uniref:Uncharacterized protein n=1 Tax=Botryotinia convoluta TaxID=54673 RepID=A0A4Z1I922_9HELO|nr:hypothetical protein BCON_0058g00010 [Botryotinia convoluta]
MIETLTLSGLDVLLTFGWRVDEPVYKAKLFFPGTPESRDIVSLIQIKLMFDHQTILSVKVADDDKVVLSSCG